MASRWRAPSALIPLTIGLAACGGGYAGNSPEQARSKAEAVMKGTGWQFDRLTKGQDNLTHKAWVAHFTPAPGETSGFGGAYKYGFDCVVYVRDGEATPSPDCSR
jgi:hypothetical protein